MFPALLLASRRLAHTPDSFKYTFSASVPELLTAAHASLWVSTYQAGKLAVFRANEKSGLSLLLRTFDKAMGLALDPNRLAIGTRHQVWQQRNESGLAPKIAPKGTWDACYLPRQSHITGGIVIDVASGEIITRGLSMPHSPRWHDGRLWVLDSGNGRLVTVDPESGERETVAVPYDKRRGEQSAEVQTALPPDPFLVADLSPGRHRGGTETIELDGIAAIATEPGDILRLETPCGGG